MADPWTPRSAEVKRPVEADVARQKKFGVGRHYPAMAHVALSRLRAIVAGELAGARNRSGGLGAQLKNMGEVLEDARKTNQGAAAMLAQEQFCERQQLASGRRGIKQIEPQLQQPNHSLVARAIGD